MKSRINWLSLGDKNNSFFHTSTLIRRRKNKVCSLELEDGTTTFNPEVIRDNIYDYFKNSYSSNIFSNPLNFLIDNLPCISSDDHDNLISIPSTYEITNILFSIHPFKAPGDDGLNAYFYQHTWSITKNTIIPLIQDIFQN